MPLSTYLFVLFGISMVFYLMGYQPAMFVELSSAVGTEESAAQKIINNIYAIFTNPAFLVMLGVSAVSSFLVAGGNFSIFYIIPLMILVTIANMFILPSSYLFDNTLPFFFRTAIAIFFNLFLTLAIIEFVKGGGV